jgi:hypothetical protein
MEESACAAMVEQLRPAGSPVKEVVYAATYGPLGCTDAQTPMARRANVGQMLLAVDQASDIDLPRVRMKYVEGSNKEDRYSKKKREEERKKKRKKKGLYK